MRATVANRAVTLLVGDITRQQVDAIVNAANRRLAGGGGVDGAIHHAAGPELMAELRQKYPHGCQTGSAAITGAGRLPCRWVIHAVGPIWDGGGAGEPAALRSAYRTSLELARAHQCRSVALPAISAGVYGYPLRQAAEIALATVRDFPPDDTLLVDVRLVLFSDDIYREYAAVLRQMPGFDKDAVR